MEQALEQSEKPNYTEWLRLLKMKAELAERQEMEAQRWRERYDK